MRVDRRTLTRSAALKDGFERNKGVIAWLGVAGAAYVITGVVGLRWAAVADTATLYWLPSGIAIFTVLCLGWVALPIIWLSAFTVNSLTPLPPTLAALIATGNMTEAGVGGSLLRRIGFDPRRPTVQGILRFFAVAAFACIFAATVGALGLSATGRADFFEAWRAWYAGDLLGVFLVAAFVMGLLRVLRVSDG